MIVVNSSPLIILVKQARLDIFRKSFGKLLIPRAVFDEIMKKRASYEALALIKAIKEGWINVKQIKVNSLLSTINIGKGEKEAISLAAKLNLMLIIDDDIAKRYASLLKVESHGVLYVLLLAARKHYINNTEAKNILNKMISDGFYISTDLYLRFFDFLQK